MALIAIVGVVLGGAIAAGSSYYTAKASRSAEFEKFTVTQRKEMYAKYLSQLDNVLNDTSGATVMYVLKNAESALALSKFKEHAGKMMSSRQTLGITRTELSIVGSDKIVDASDEISTHLSNIGGFMLASIEAWQKQPRDDAALDRQSNDISTSVDKVFSLRSLIVREARKDIHTD